MNRNFINYATNIAFSVQLTKAQIRALVVVSSPKNAAARLQYTQPKSYDSLIKKGMIELDEKQQLVLTKPGELIVKLLYEAGLIERDRRQLLSPKFVESLHKEFIA